MKLNINLKNCYGINSLEKELNFSKKKIFSIYASNGIMKTSFAKTFKDLSLGNASKDEIYTEREPIRKITKDDSDLEKDDVFVIMPYDREYKSDNIAKLLINPRLKEKFDKEYNEIKTEKDIFLDLIKESSGLKPEKIETEICNVIKQGQKDSFFEALERIEKEVLNDEEPLYKNIEYGKLFNVNTEKIFEDEQFRKNINNYMKRYNEILEKSTFFKKGIFNPDQASDVATQLEKNGFFDAEHSVMLREENKQIKTKKELVEIIDGEKNQILQDETLKEEFDKINRMLKKNQNIKELRDYLSDNPLIVSSLSNIHVLKDNLWTGYMKQNKNNFKNLILKYNNSKKTIEKIKEQAKKEQSDWSAVIEEFNNKFFVPFTLHVSNQVDCVLGDTAHPTIQFKFKTKDVEEKKLLEVLSQGERRALYILHILFEIKVRAKKNTDCLLVIDDIADSFDYKNKYAIIEYLKEISEIKNFYLIILTHNFDFHRSVSSRLGVNRANKLNAVKLKENDNIKLEEEFYQKNPLIHWRKNLDDPIMLLASIPMIRNLFEYSGKDCEFNEISKFLHILQDTNDLTILDLKKIYTKIFDKEITDRIKNLDEKFYDFLTQKCTESNDDNKLENKIILSIAIRLKAEEFMILKINDNEYTSSITTNQTFTLFTKYKEKFCDYENIKILERVNLMTPENIHLNSFMYEPILDMSSDELRNLYNDIEKVMLEAKRS